MNPGLYLGMLLLNGPICCFSSISVKLLFSKASFLELLSPKPLTLGNIHY